MWDGGSASIARAGGTRDEATLEGVVLTELRADMMVRGRKAGLAYLGLGATLAQSKEFCGYERRRG